MKGGGSGYNSSGGGSLMFVVVLDLAGPLFSVVRLLGRLMFVTASCDDNVEVGKAEVES